MLQYNTQNWGISHWNSRIWEWACLKCKLRLATLQIIFERFKNGRKITIVKKNTKHISIKKICSVNIIRRGENLNRNMMAETLSKLIILPCTPACIFNTKSTVIKQSLYWIACSQIVLSLFVLPWGSWFPY